MRHHRQGGQGECSTSPCRIGSERPRWIWADTVWAALGLILGAGTGFVPAACAGVEVSPARLAVWASPGDWLPALRVSNRTVWPLEITAYLGPGGHDEDGNPIYGGDIRSASASPIPLRVVLLPARLGPGEVGEVRLQIAANAQQVEPGGLSPIVYLQFEPQTTGLPSRSGIRPVGSRPDRFQVAVPLLVRWRGTVPPRVQVVAAGLEPLAGPPGGNQLVRAWVRVRNGADCAGQVRVGLRLEDQGGQPILADSGGLPPGWILPGLTRRWCTEPIALDSVDDRSRLLVSVWVEGQLQETVGWQVQTVRQGGGGHSAQVVEYECMPLRSPDVGWPGRITYRSALPHLDVGLPESAFCTTHRASQ